MDFNLLLLIIWGIVGVINFIEMALKYKASWVSYWCVYSALIVSIINRIAS